MRESNCDFNTHLHNGDPLNDDGRYKRTTHVPAGKPVAPPTNGKTYTFEESALDALRTEFKSLQGADIAEIAFYFEKYNGFGYRQRGVASPYLWASSNQYIKGKYVEDGAKGWRPEVVDKQLGVMPVLKVILEKVDAIAIPVMEAQAQGTAAPAPISPSADIEKPKSAELRKTSRKFRLVEWAQHFFGWTTGITATGATLSTTNITATKSFIDTVKAFGADYGVFLVIGTLILGFIATQYLKEWMKQDVAENRAIPSGDA
jgi:lysozyme family protein